MKKNKPIYRIIGAYDSETTNYIQNGNARAFPVLHQLGLIDCDITEINPDNVEQHTYIHMFRHTVELYAKLDDIVSTSFDYVPVICCHNLSFDMYGLSQWLNAHDVRVLAKSARKPITFTVLDDAGNARLVIWDTLIFTQKSLERMGKDCGYSKAVGEWNYDLIRTPETPLTPEETEYASKDVYALVCYMAWFTHRNPDINPDKLAYQVTTKTGIVRERRKIRFSNKKGLGRKYNIGKYWLYQNQKEKPKTDDELYTMQACLRGGFTFVSSACANVPFDLRGTGQKIYAFDATSQHPAQIVSHMYPEDFHPASKRVLDSAAELVGLVTVDRILNKWENPFNVAFEACFKITNIRPKANSIFALYGIMPLASARFSKADLNDDDNGDRSAHEDNRIEKGYSDTAVNPVFAFGKLVSADSVNVWITELTLWEIYQCYDFDSIEAVSGYLTGRFCRPSDMAVISVMQFYKAKNEFKKARSCYYDGKPISNAEILRKLGVSDAIVDSMLDKTISKQDIESTYLSLKADLNALFGIEASNEYRRDTILTPAGIAFDGGFGLQNAPKNPKAWYQFGTRIVGWSRIAQICIMQLVSEYSFAIVNGDTDSVKILTDAGCLQDVQEKISVLSRSIDNAKRKVCARARISFPDLYDSLKDIGHYVYEFDSDCFCAAWNKAYCSYNPGKDGKRHFDFTIAGIPADRGLNAFADNMIEQGYTFEQVCNLLLGYNVTFANDLLRLNARKFPEWGDVFYESVTDYLGNKSKVCEPAALAIYPMSKTINDTRNKENFENMLIAYQNNPAVNRSNIMIYKDGILDFDEMRLS